MQVGMQPLVSQKCIAWDPEGISYIAQRTLQQLAALMGVALTADQLEQFQRAVISMTPVAAYPERPAWPVARFANGVVIYYDNGIRPGIAEFGNTPQLVVLHASPQLQFAALLMVDGDYEVTSSSSFRLRIVEGGLMRGWASLCQKPLSPLPGEGNN